MAEEETQPAGAAPEAQPVAPALSGGPWQSDIEQSFTDPQVRATVDAFMRGKVQPRMTQLEQQVAQTETARVLWQAFQEDPAAAYAEITRELYGDEAAKVALEALEQNLTPPPAAGAAAAGEVAAPAQPSVDPNTMLTPDEVQAWRREQELRAYDTEVERVLSDPTNQDIDRDLYHTFVAAADGDFSEAVLRYRDHVAKVLTRYGIDPSQATPDQQTQAATVAAAEQRGAPPVVGNDAGGALPSSTSTQADYRAQGLSSRQALHQAIEDAASQTRRNAEAPPVAG